MEKELFKSLIDHILALPRVKRCIHNYATLNDRVKLNELDKRFVEDFVNRYVDSLTKWPVVFEGGYFTIEEEETNIIGCIAEIPDWLDHPATVDFRVYCFLTALAAKSEVTNEIKRAVGKAIWLVDNLPCSEYAFVEENFNGMKHVVCNDYFDESLFISNLAYLIYSGKLSVNKTQRVLEKKIEL